MTKKSITRRAHTGGKTQGKQKPLRFGVVSLFPNAFESYLGESILKRAQEDGKLTVSFANPRDYADNTWRRIDRPPYGGGPGLVIQALPVATAVARLTRRGSKPTVIFFSPGGTQFDNAYAKRLARSGKDIILVCGRYEGIDARVKRMIRMQEISVGPFVLTGGEVPAMIVIDAVARQRKGILGNFDSVEERRVSSHDSYTRPEAILYRGKTYRVPKVLLSGDHQAIARFKEKAKTTKRTKAIKPVDNSLTGEEK
jgi:tRNA (guanine37-N1)-methyltransferase